MGEEPVKGPLQWGLGSEPLRTTGVSRDQPCLIPRVENGRAWGHHPNGNVDPAPAATTTHVTWAFLWQWSPQPQDSLGG